MVFVLNNLIQKKKKNLEPNGRERELFFVFLLVLFRQISGTWFQCLVADFGNVVSSRLFFIYYFNVCIWIQVNGNR